MSAGFPCQPFSNAGKRKGSEDDRHIWPENMRIFREAQPAFIVCENVPGIVTIENGMVFEQVCLDLENEGYEVQTFIIPAVATDKDHRRDRIWIVAYSDSYGHRNINRSSQDTGTEAKSEGYGLQREWIRNEFRGDDTITSNSNNGRQEEQEQQTTRDKQCDREFTANSKFEGLQGIEITRQQPEYFQHERYNPNATDTRSERQPGQGKHGGQLYSEANGIKEIYRTINGNKLKETWLEAATRLCTLDDGYARGLDITAISKSKWRKESLKAAGNTIVWEIAFEIFKAIEETSKLINL